MSCGCNNGFDNDLFNDLDADDFGLDDLDADGFGLDDFGVNEFLGNNGSNRRCRRRCCRRCRRRCCRRCRRRCNGSGNWNWSNNGVTTRNGILINTETNEAALIRFRGNAPIFTVRENNSCSCR